LVEAPIRTLYKHHVTVAFAEGIKTTTSVSVVQLRECGMAPEC